MLFQAFDSRALRNHHMNVMFTCHDMRGRRDSCDSRLRAGSGATLPSARRCGVLANRHAERPTSDHRLQAVVLGVGVVVGLAVLVIA